METIQIELTRLFVKVIQQGSFSRAAEVLKVPKSTVSKAITRLEKETGTKLLMRTTRSHTLTAAGRAFYETCVGPIQILEDAQKSLNGQDSIVSGKIRLTAPEDLGNFIIAPVIGDLCKRHPHLSFELNYTNDIVDLVKDGFDLAIRIGELDENSLRAKRIGEVFLVLVAAPSYCERNEKVKQPKDLSQHVCLSLSEYTPHHSWELIGKKGRIEVPVKIKVESNQMSSLLQTALAGAGIALVPYYLCKKQIASGKLIRILPDWASEGITVSVVSPVAMASSARLKVVSDQIFEAVKKGISEK